MLMPMQICEIFFFLDYNWSQQTQNDYYINYQWSVQAERKKKKKKKTKVHSSSYVVGHFVPTPLIIIGQSYFCLCKEYGSVLTHTFLNYSVIVFLSLEKEKEKKRGSNLTHDVGTMWSKFTSLVIFWRQHWNGNKVCLCTMIKWRNIWFLKVIS